MRFTVELHGLEDDAYCVKDNEASRWRLPEKAVSLYLRRSRAYIIADLLNEEWADFNANPR